jgi:hypothetical protein
MTALQNIKPITFSSSAASAAAAPVAHQLEQDWVTRNLYPAVEQLFTAPGRVGDFFEAKKIQAAADETLPLYARAYNWVVSVFQTLGKMAFDHDYREYPGIPKSFGKGMFGFLGENLSEKIGTALSKFKVSEPPVGALILLLFPFTVLPRLLRAAKRDSREVGDVLRRDLTAITIFLFALKPLQTVLTKLSEKFDGLKLIHRDGEFKGTVKTYQQLSENLKINNAETLLALAKEQGEALKKATFFMYDGGLEKAGFNGELAKHITDFKTKLNELVAEAAGNSTKQGQLAEEAFGLIQKMDGLRNTAAKNVTAGADATISKMMKRLPEFSNFFVRYAKARRLPVDIFSFALVCVGIGWFPVWFNDMWNKKQFAAKMAAKNQQQNTAPVDPALLFSALKNSSKLGRNFQ